MKRYDVAVIGGGLLGTASAYYLSRAGAETVLLEKGQLNREASGQNAGSLHFQLEFRMVEHGGTLAEQFARALPLVLDAQTRWADVEREIGADLEIVQNGGLMVAETVEQVDALQRKLDLEERYGLRTELIDGDEARTRAPYLSRGVRAAGWCAEEGHANPRLVGPAFARAARSGGCRIHTEPRAVSLSRASGGWKIRIADAPPLHATAVLIAAGIWTGAVAAMADVRFPVVPVALTMLVTEATPPFIGHVVQHVGRRLSLKQAGDGNVLIGGAWPAKLQQRDGVVDLDGRPHLRYESLTGNAWTAAHVVPAVRSLALLRAWSGVASVLADQLPLLGAVRRRPGLFVATGGSGFTLGPTFAYLMAQLIVGGRPSLPLETFTPDRFAHLNIV